MNSNLLDYFNFTSSNHAIKQNSPNSNNIDKM